MKITNEEYGNQPIGAFAFKIAEDATVSHSGMTLRQHYAGLAMQGMLANHSLIDSEYDYETLMKEAVKQADTLIAELNKDAQ